jgi:ribonuclease III
LAEPAPPDPAPEPAVPAELTDRLGHTFDDPGLLATALRHRSWCVEHPGGEPNERLEFLGDAVLDLVVTDELFRRHPDLPEGRLTEARKAVVSSAGLAPVAAALGLGAALRLGRGEEQSGGRSKPSLLENAFEALVGAVYLDGGLGAAQDFVTRHLGGTIEGAAHDPGNDFKSRLQELAASRSLSAPRYEIAAAGPDHARQFVALVTVGDAASGRGEGRTKKQAEQAAAQRALVVLADPEAAAVTGDLIGADAGSETNDA